MAVSKNVMIIPAIKRMGNNRKEDETPKLRVVAYCRVSTDSDEQASSYEVQIEHYTEFIKKNSEWEFAGIFADDGISGTNTKISETDNNLVYEIDKRLEELQKDLLRLANSKEDYNDIADEIYRLRDERHKVLEEEAGKKGSKQRLEEMVDFLNEQPTLLEEYDEQLVKKLIEKITVYDDKLTIEFKSGVEIDIEI
ncbi:recombinase family protein [Ligilactobacillus agilis]|uniref:recombinase family protein n=1 Tax=Ligilactobacillus agilis TaxID=1601 RepID=UPI003A4D5E3E